MVKRLLYWTYHPWRFEKKMIETGWVLIKRRMGRLRVLMDDGWEDCMSGECRIPISWAKSDKCKEFCRDIRSQKGRMLFT